MIFYHQNNQKSCKKRKSIRVEIDKINRTIKVVLLSILIELTILMRLTNYSKELKDTICRLRFNKCNKIDRIDTNRRISRIDGIDRIDRIYNGDIIEN